MPLFIPGSSSPSFGSTSSIWASMGHSFIAGAGTTVSNTNPFGINPDFSQPRTEATTLVNKRLNSIVMWAEFHSRGRVMFPMALNFGGSGDRTVNLPGRMGIAIAAAKAANAAGIFVFSNGNDFALDNATAATVITAMQAVRDGVLAAGLKLCWYADTPRGNATTTTNRLTATQLKHALKARRELMSWRNIPGVIIVDGQDGFVDPATTTGDVLSANMFQPDVLHPSFWGAFALGKRLADALSPFHTANIYLPAGNGDLRDAALNPLGIATADPFFTSTGAAVGTNGTGVIAGLWPLITSPAARAGYTAVYSQPVTVDPATGTSKRWQQVVYAGTPTGAGQYDAMVQNLSLATFAPGTIVQSIAEVEWDAGMTGINYLKFGAQGNRPAGSGSFWLAFVGQVADAQDSAGIPAGSGYLIGEPFAVPFDATSIQMRFETGYKVNNPLAATIRVRGAGLAILS